MTTRSPRSRIALVTGANQNLGRALVAGLAARMTPADRVLLTGRDPARVFLAARELSAQIPDGAVIEPRVLDVRDPHAIRSLAADLGEVDIVFSNAAARMSPDDDPADAVDVVADTNNTATTMMLREFAPRLRDGGRLIIVASALGTLDKLPESVRPRFAEAAAADLDAVDRLVDEWRHSVKAGRAVREGFGSWLNIPSKVAQVAAVRAIGRTRRSDDVQHGTAADGPVPRADRHRRVTAVVRRHEQRSNAASCRNLARRTRPRRSLRSRVLRRTRAIRHCAAVGSRLDP